MIKQARPILALALFATLFACGGSGGPAVMIDNHFLGDWLEEDNSVNPISITIQSNGNVTGTSINTVLGGIDNLSGVMDEDGDFEGQIVNSVDTTQVITLQGSFVYLEGTNQLHFSYTGNDDGEIESGDIYLNKD